MQSVELHDTALVRNPWVIRSGGPDSSERGAIEESVIRVIRGRSAAAEEAAVKVGSGFKSTQRRKWANKSNP